MNLRDQRAGTGPAAIGGLGMWSVDHAGRVVNDWLVAAVALESWLPSLEHSLSAAGWEATGSESVAVHDTVQTIDPGASSYALTVVMSAREPDGASRAFDAARERVAATMKMDAADALMIRYGERLTAI